MSVIAVHQQDVDSYSFYNADQNVVATIDLINTTHYDWSVVNDDESAFANGRESTFEAAYEEVTSWFVRHKMLDKVVVIK
jgi:hypothetical protein